LKSNHGIQNEPRPGLLRFLETIFLSAKIYYDPQTREKLATLKTIPIDKSKNCYGWVEYGRFWTAPTAFTREE